MTPLFDPLNLHAAVCETPAILRLRMLELRFGIRGRELSRDARQQAEAAIAELQTAIILRPGLTLADATAKLRTLSELADKTAPSSADSFQLGQADVFEWDMAVA
jgi:hypothetical protein